MSKISFSPIGIPPKDDVEYADKYAVMMVEPRDKDLYIILESVEKQLTPEWEFYFFGSDVNEGVVRRWFTKNSKRKLHFFKIPSKFMIGKTNLEYSKFLENPWIWKTIKAENILLVQTDAALCDHGKINPKQFTQFPYIGCAYSGEHGMDSWWKYKNKNTYFYGVGGLSMRKRSFMMSCIKNNIDDGVGVPEDVFFSTCLGEAVNRPELKPNAKDMHKLCSETNYDKKYGRPTFSVHKPGLSMSLEDMKDLRSDCPVAWKIGMDERFEKKSKERN
jgi:hypothetical protein